MYRIILSLGLALGLVLGVTVAEAAYVFGKPKEIHNDKEPLMLDFTQIKGVIKLDPSSMRLLELINFPLDVPEGATHIAFFKDGESAQYVAFENGVGMFPAFAMVTYYPCNRFNV